MLEPCQYRLCPHKKYCMNFRGSHEAGYFQPCMKVMENVHIDCASALFIVSSTLYVKFKAAKMSSAPKLYLKVLTMSHKGNKVIKQKEIFL